MKNSDSLKIGIIGAGFVGLTAAFKLSLQGHKVTVIESVITPGGLASGFQDKNWKWSLEEHYHHLFTNDNHIIKLAKQIEHPLLKKRVKTATYFQKYIYQLDSPLNLLSFKPLTFFERIRTGFVLAYIKISPFYIWFEKITTQKFLRNTMGEKSWQILWYPLMFKKFARFYDKIALSWFWARIKKRTPSLMYPKGGFKSLAEKLASKVEENGGEILYGKRVSKIISNKGKVEIVDDQNKRYVFDKVICTLPTSQFTKIADNLPESYIKKTKKLTGIGAINLLLVLKKPFLTNGTYWLNINETKFPFLNIVEQTNFMSPKNYGRDSIIYIGNYLENNHPFFSLNEKQLLKEYLPYLKKINPIFKFADIKKIRLSKAYFAQPIIFKNYSKIVPPFETPIPNVYLANIQQVYPWDRGTNYAVELGNKIAKIVG